MSGALLKRRVWQANNVGWWQAGFYLLQAERVKRLRPSEPFTLFSKDSRHGLSCRPNTSDLEVFSQIFLRREYRCLDEIEEPGLIIDCGANVGYSSAYFLTRFPKARLIAIEPDPDNFSALKRNLQRFGSRAKAICSGVWSRETGLVISEEPFGDGREWARTVRAAKEGETPHMMAKDVGALLRESGFERISILKVDIEGSEAEVFGTNYEQWIDKVDNIVIELHGETCAKIFETAIAGKGFEVERCEELMVCKKPR